MAQLAASQGSRLAVKPKMETFAKHRPAPLIKEVKHEAKEERKARRQKALPWVLKQTVPQQKTCQWCGFMVGRGIFLHEKWCKSNPDRKVIDGP